MQNEKQNVKDRRKKLIFRSCHRGTKEMDLIMGSFASVHVPDFTEEELAQYEALLCESDPDLYDWITQKSVPSAEILEMPVFKKLMQHSLF